MDGGGWLMEYFVFLFFFHTYEVYSFYKVKIYLYVELCTKKNLVCFKILVKLGFWSLHRESYHIHGQFF